MPEYTGGLREWFGEKPRRAVACEPVARRGVVRAALWNLLPTIEKTAPPTGWSSSRRCLPYFRRARTGEVAVGDLVYYGPMPTYYGIGEVVQISEKYVVVDFRGTGLFGVHEEAMESQYLLPIPADRVALL